MKLSRNFLNDYIDLNKIKAEEIATKMVFAGNEYETVYKLVEASNLVIGEIKECIKHPESNKLSICKVDIKESVNQIICGAPNVQTGQKVIVAKVGAELPGEIKIKEATLAGYKSEGMICSLLELGIDSKFLTEEDKAGIHVLSDDAKIGENPIEYLNLNDEIIDFELTSNRADLLSVIGMAYEVGALFDLKVNLKEPKINYIDDEQNLTLEVNTDKCSIYLGGFAKNITIKDSPYFIKARLIASGIRPINNVVDISNYVMLETGQPLHFFNLDKLDKVIVRQALENEEIITLDENKRLLDPSDIVIADSKKPIALAGVMGGLETEVTSDTKNIFIEAAIFDSNSVRATSNKILRSEASNRFEKGIDPNRTLFALKRAQELLQIYASADISSQILTYDNTNKEEKIIKLNLEKVNKVLGMNLQTSDVLNVFNKLSFKSSDQLEVSVPTRRLDINIEEDLIEEIGRIHGYDKLEGKLPLVNIKKGSYTKKAKLIKELRTLMSSLSLNQVLTYSLVKKEDIDTFSNDKKDIIELLSPMSEDKKVLRQSLLPGLLSVYEYNNARGINDINIFEIGSVYYKNIEYKEDTYLSGLLSGTYISNNWQGLKVTSDFYLLKGIIENIMNYLGMGSRFSIDTNNIKNGFHQGVAASIYVDRKLIGHFGKVDPKISSKDVYLFEINLEELLNINVREIKFKEMSKYPSVSRDLAFVVDENQESKAIMDIIKNIAGKLLVDVDMFDLYQGVNKEENKKSLAYSFTLQDFNKTLNEEEINNIMNKIVEEVLKNNLGVLRSK